MFADIILDTFLDTVKMIPFLLVAYFLIEYIERKQSSNLEQVIKKTGKFGFIPGAILGLLPQCGFSAMVADLYSGNVITLGTLFAVFISTSDEALPILLANPDRWSDIILLLSIKFILAVLFGFIVDFIFRKFVPCNKTCGFSGNISDVNCHDHNEEEGLILATIRHTFNIVIYIFIIEFLINTAIAYFGEDLIAEVVNKAGVFQIFAASLVGMIPNCAASVLLTEMYLKGSLSLGAMIAGLSTGSGLGALVLIKTNKNKRQVALILLALYFMGIISGFGVSLISKLI